MANPKRRKRRFGIESQNSDWKDRLIAQLTENGQREDVDPKDEGDALLALAGGKQSPGGDRKSNHYCTATMISQADLAKMLGGVSKSLSGNGTGSGDTLRH